MRELQGAIIIGAAFQTLLGYTGLMSLLVRYGIGIFSASLFFVVSIYLYKLQLFTKQNLLLWIDASVMLKAEKFMLKNCRGSSETWTQIL